MELFARSSTASQEIPVLEQKAVFPNDASDFELIRQYDGASCIPAFPALDRQAVQWG
jgi:hypothetical protein